MTTLLAQTHLATVGMCRCLVSGLPIALKMYHRDRLTPKMELQARPRHLSRQYVCNVLHAQSIQHIMHSFDTHQPISYSLHLAISL